VMDINPDQAVALGAFTANSLPARFLAWINKRLVKGAESVVCLDVDMLKRLGVTQTDIEPLDSDISEGDPTTEPSPTASKFSVIPPWPLEADLQYIPKAENPFVREHGLANAFVFMYSGNHSLVHPLGTLLDGIEDLKDSPDCVFAFIGGGRGKADVEKRIHSADAADGGPKLLSLPYQPLDQIKYSLSAADVQIVSFGNEMIGIVHPCKFYSAMLLGQPILLLGPQASALGRLISEHNIGWCVEHGDTEKMTQVLKQIMGTSKEDLLAMGIKAKDLAHTTFSREKLCGDFCDKIETCRAE
jgi:colanic acid biosynthesis glycosyl transferase WcaI